MKSGMRLVMLLRLPRLSTRELREDATQPTMVLDLHIDGNDKKYFQAHI
jgi:hypothetical protein